MNALRMIIVMGLLLSLTNCTNANSTLLPRDIALTKLPKDEETPFFVLKKGVPFMLDFAIKEWCFVRAQSNEVFGFVLCEEIDVVLTNGELSGLTVIVDAGHGGMETGAHYFGMAEKDINREVAQKLAKQLRRAGANVVMTRKEDETIRLYTRPSYANLLGLLSLYLDSETEDRVEMEPFLLELQDIITTNAAHVPSLYQKHPEENKIPPRLAKLMNWLHGEERVILVAIHSNSTKDQSLGHRGTEIIIADNTLSIEYPGYDLFDETSRDALRNALKVSFQEAEVLPWRKSYVGDYAILRESNVPSVLIELGYLNHKEENQLLRSSEVQEDLANVIFDGIASWYRVSQMEKSE